MGLERIYQNEGCKVIKAVISAGKRMPVHHATSEAFIMVTKGKGELIYSNHEIPLEEGAHVKIPKSKPHTLKVDEDFEAYIVIAGVASMEFNSGTKEAEAYASDIDSI